MAINLSDLTITINGREFPLSTKLRVAYKLQAQHNHASYIEVFNKIGEMKLEEQIGILWAAFEVANPEEAKTITQIGFMNYCLDNLNLKDLMDKVGAVSRVMMGIPDDDEEVEEEEHPQYLGGGSPLPMK